MTGFYYLFVCSFNCFIVNNIEVFKILDDFNGICLIQKNTGFYYLLYKNFVCLIVYTVNK